jgi:hypothetical protein
MKVIVHLVIALSIESLNVRMTDALEMSGSVMALMTAAMAVMRNAVSDWM